MSAILDVIFDTIRMGAIASLLLLFPESPFKGLQVHMPQGFLEVLAYVNYYVPFGVLAIITMAWLSAVGIYYGHKFMLRLLKAKM
jgi:hypothetical protein